jgi:CMP-2-keto-3-deoxyoctulosonic acid synthetase
MVATKTPPLHVLRGILRRLQVENHLGTKGGRDATRAHVLSQYRQNKTLSAPEQIEQLRKMAYDYLKLKDDLAERERLYKIDTGAEVQLSPKELSRRAAARTGLQLPQLDPELEKDLKR